MAVGPARRPPLSCCPAPVPTTTTSTGPFSPALHEVGGTPGDGSCSAARPDSSRATSRALDDASRENADRGRRRVARRRGRHGMGKSPIPAGWSPCWRRCRPGRGSPQGAPAALAALQSAHELRRDGPGGRGPARMQASSPPWLAAELTRSWVGQWPELAGRDGRSGRLRGADERVKLGNAGSADGGWPAPPTIPSTRWRSALEWVAAAPHASLRTVDAGPRSAADPRCAGRGLPGRARRYLGPGGQARRWYCAAAAWPKALGRCAWRPGVARSRRLGLLRRRPGAVCAWPWAAATGPARPAAPKLRGHRLPESVTGSGVAHRERSVHRGELRCPPMHSGPRRPERRRLSWGPVDDAADHPAIAVDADESAPHRRLSPTTSRPPGDRSRQRPGAASLRNDSASSPATLAPQTRGLGCRIGGHGESGRWG